MLRKLSYEKNLSSKSRRELEFLFFKFTYPYKNLNRFLKNMKPKNKEINYEILDIFTENPCTAMTPTRLLAPSDRQERKRLQQRVLDIGRILVSCGLLVRGIFKSEEDGFPYNKSFWQTQFFYNPRWHSRSEVQLLKTEYLDYCESLGRRETKIKLPSPEEKRDLRKRRKWLHIEKRNVEKGNLSNYTLEELEQELDNIQEKLYRVK